jgi:hypothetical protein
MTESSDQPLSIHTIRMLTDSRTRVINRKSEDKSQKPDKDLNQLLQLLQFQDNVQS